MKNNKNNKLIFSIQLINVFIGITITLIFGITYMTIESRELKGILLGLLIVFGIIIFITLYRKIHNESYIEESNSINTIELVNEENEIIKQWEIQDKISFLIGKNNKKNHVFVDLDKSIYSTLVEENHAVLNYAAGTWYIEDLSLDSGVCIQKIDDGKKYRIVKNIPCSLKKGDIIFISKVKLLLR
ncbi:FHA domain-containing protein [Clostridium botulinum]|uniref:FHA domain-containing protein n=1 Tax=unclassified Clostridium TaxID=2614128 RepID=UPI00050602B5|nr:MULTISPECIES: FHA domain-containing protein [unclassified Clostridium]AIY80118.1 FHA domain protein [Clostridium botulinum 202F]KFX54938.1 Forkhead-associated protein [Clostridium botulinum]KFX57659.1 Forkhead-associated protein [Clostridium botulinum]KON12288.1 Forkhead-associated protein [Clostridium botulinum]MBY6778240.1 FHA domain-containing protein [Clostridium botulinum]